MATYKELSMYLSARPLVSGETLLCRLLGAPVYPAGIPAKLQDGGSNAPPRLDNCRTIDLIGQPRTNEEHASQKIMGEFDELLCALAWVARNAERFDPDTVEGMA